MFPLDISFSGTDFAASELQPIHETVRDFPNISPTKLSKTICKLLDWKLRTGKLEHEEYRAFLESPRDQGFLKLPGQRATAAPGPRHVISTA